MPAPSASRRRSTRTRKKETAPRWWWAIPIFLLLVFALLALVLLPSRSQTGGEGKASSSALPAVVSVNRAYVMYRDENAFLLDVRSRQEFDIVHIPAIGGKRVVNIPLNELFSRLDEIPKERDIVIICTTGNQSERARDLLLEAGFPRVTSVSGGMQVWIDNNLPVEGTFPK